MLNVTADATANVVSIEPQGPLEGADFEQLATVVDPIIASRGSLAGLLIHTKSFPGWQDFAGFLSHMRFVKDHQSKIGKVAVVTDSAIGAVGPGFANIFVSAEIKHFKYEEMDRAQAWLGATDTG